MKQQCPICPILRFTVLEYEELPQISEIELFTGYIQENLSPLIQPSAAQVPGCTVTASEPTQAEHRDRAGMPVAQMSLAGSRRSCQAQAPRQEPRS